MPEQTCRVESERSFSAHEFMSYMHQEMQGVVDGHYVWPKVLHEREGFAQSKYATPEGIHWLCDQIDAMSPDVRIEDRYPDSIPVQRGMATVEDVDAFVERDDTNFSSLHHGLVYSETAYLEKRILEWAIEYGDETNIERLVEFAGSRYRGAVHKGEFSELFNKLGAFRASQVIRERLQAGKKESSKWKEKKLRHYAQILYRLELGRIGISEGGVEYLGKRFDLGEWNNPSNSVRRLTPEGDLGVIDENDMLQKIFNVGDLTEEGKGVVSPNLLDITKEMLFTPRADETKEDALLRESILEEFKQKYNSFFDDSFLEKTGVHVNNLPLKEQGWFLHFTQQTDKVTQDRAHAFVKVYGENGLRTFLAAEYGDEVGQRVLELGDVSGNLEQKRQVQEIFRLYGTTLDTAEVLRTKLQETKTHERNEQLVRVIDQTYEALVRRSKDLLLAAHEIAVRKSIETELTLTHVQVALTGVNLLLELLTALDGEGGYDVELVQTVKEKDYSVLKYHICSPSNDEDLHIQRKEYFLKLLARPEETHRADGSVQAEARVNIELDFDTPYPVDLQEKLKQGKKVLHPNEPLRSAFYTNTEFPEQKKCVERHTLRLGIDRDTYYEGGQVSLDLGRGDHTSETLKRSGDVVGRLLQLVSEDGSHNTASFDKELADPQIFKQLVELLVERLS